MLIGTKRTVTTFSPPPTEESWDLIHLREGIQIRPPSGPAIDMTLESAALLAHTIESMVRDQHDARDA